MKTFSLSALKYLKTLSLSLGFALAPTSLMAQGVGVLSWDLMHTRPECQDGTFCLATEKKQAALLSGMEAKVAEMAQRAQGPGAKIYIAYFSFSNTASFNALCEAGQRGVEIEGYFDTDYSGDESNYPNRLGLQCQKNPQGPKNVNVYFLGKKQKNPDGSLVVWRLHHNKFLIVDPGNKEPINLNFSSGNLSSSGLSIHFDHWVTLLVDPDSNVLRTHLCVVKALKAAITDKSGNQLETDRPEVYQAVKQTCSSEAKLVIDVEAQINKESIAVLLAPNQHDEVYQTLKSTINSVKTGGRIYGAIQHFLHQGIRSDLARAVKRGVKVDMIMDDDVVLGSSEVPGVGDFYEQYLKPSGIKIRFLRTNADVMQMMHNKFLIFEMPQTSGKIKTRVFSGAGHFTTSAMKNNYENFYLTENSTLTVKYQDLFNYIWSRSITEAEATKLGGL